MLLKVVTSSAQSRSGTPMLVNQNKGGNAQQSPTPIQYFVGVDRVYAVLWYAVICTISLILHVAFVLVS